MIYRRTEGNPIAEGVNVTLTLENGTIIDGHVHWVPVEPDYEAAEDALDDWLNERWEDERTVYEGAKAIVDAAHVD